VKPGGLARGPVKVFTHGQSKMKKYVEISFWRAQKQAVPKLKGL
jgi:hypothetical protein